MKKITQLSSDLPADPGSAIVEFVQRVDKALKSQKSWADDDLFSVQLFIEKFITRFKLGSTVTFDKAVPLRDRVKYYVGNILKNRAAVRSTALGAEVDDALQHYIERQQENTFGLAKLNAEEKKKILNHLEKIRLIIESSPLPDRKKNALYARLNALIQEVNLHGTMTDRFFAFAGDLGFVLGDMTKKAKPLVEEIKEVLRIISRSRARQEGISLPAGDEVLRLPTPDEPS
jgi:hypothetical protein